jgi:hypothetical protein
VVCKGGKPVRNRIQRAFAHRLLGAPEALERVHRRTFDLDKLLRPIPFPTDPPDGIKSVRVTLLRLASLLSGYHRFTIEVGKDGEQDIYAVSARLFGANDPLQRAGWRVEQAKLRIIFRADPGRRRERRLTVELRAPNGSNLRDQMLRHQLIAEKYLARWGLAPVLGG